MSRIIIDNYFSAHPNATRVFRASDGRLFHQHQDKEAKAYQMGLKPSAGSGHGKLEDIEKPTDMPVQAVVARAEDRKLEKALAKKAQALEDKEKVLDEREKSLEASLETYNDLMKVLKEEQAKNTTWAEGLQEKEQHLAKWADELAQREEALAGTVTPPTPSGPNPLHEGENKAAASAAKTTEEKPAADATKPAAPAATKPAADTKTKSK